jgi:Tol biopolymer transport system component
MSAVPSRLCSAALLAAAAAWSVLAAVPAEAQYFGRNKVQYESFDFRILRTTHFDVYYYPEEEQAVRDAAVMVERWYARLSRILDHEFDQRQPLILCASHPHFQQTSTYGGDISEGTGGFTEVFKQRIVMPLSASYQETDHVLGHELVHAFQYDISGFGRAGGGLESAAQRFQVPGFFVEGMAEYLSVGPVDPHTAMWMRDAALTGRIPTLDQLTYDPSFFPYRWGQAFWAYVGGRWGDVTIGQILKQVGQGVPYPDAFQRILNASLEQIVDDWSESIRQTYLPLVAEYREASEAARPLVTRRGEGGRVNVAPALSPDGRRLAFISELSNLDIELYVADAETGEVIRRLVRGTSFDPHFASLRFINSAGTWSPDGRQFAFSALRQGRDVLVVLDVDRARIVREHSIPGVSELTNPTWSSDGRTIVVSGLRGGVSDLYAIDAQNGRSTQLTNDRFADLQPAFSPDGRTVAFVTDRGVTDFGSFTFGDVRLALMDLATREIRTLPPLGGGKNINPQWSADGSALFFVSDRTGISNIYRLELASGEVAQVTDLFTGVSGYTAMSPALSSAASVDRLAFAAYEREGFNIYSLSGPEELAGTPPAPVQLVSSGGGPVPLPALLPPAPRQEEPPYNRVLLALNDFQAGLPDPELQAGWRVVPYRPRLSLDYLGQPSVGASASTGPFNRGGLYGGVNGIFSDMLGYHNLYATVQAQGQIDEIGYSVLYVNRRHRWNWGVASQRIPYLYGLYGQTLSADRSEFLEQWVTLRYFDTSLTGLAQYPFSRVRRAEVSGGVRRIASDQIIRERVYGTVFDENDSTRLVGVRGPLGFRERRVAGESFNLAEGAAALVYDASVGGYTGPFAGRRYRMEVAPTVGSLQFTTGTADFRQYVYLRPVTLALRGMHVGRYGRDEHRVGAIYLGWPFLIRGYDRGSLARSCDDSLPLGGRDCDLYFRDLIGSRVAVANAELRVPLIRPMVVRGTLGLPPVDGFAFLDAGLAWGRVQDNRGQIVESTPVFRRGVQEGSDRGYVTSGGFGARVNVFGYFVLEGAYVNAFDRDRGWHWQFAMQPGF